MKRTTKTLAIGMVVLLAVLAGSLGMVNRELDAFQADLVSLNLEVSKAQAAQAQRTAKLKVQLDELEDLVRARETDLQRD